MTCPKCRSANLAFDFSKAFYYCGDCHYCWPQHSPMPSSPPPPIRDDGIAYMEPITAWRFWQINVKDRGGFELVSGYPGVKWLPQTPLRAVHQDRVDMYYRHSIQSIQACTDAPCEHYDPGYGYGCGIYGYKTLNSLVQSGIELRDSHLVFGEVSLWGRIYEHERGYRAQYAYPKRFIALVNTRELIEQLSQHYHVPVTYEEDSWKLDSLFENLSLNRSHYQYRPIPTSYQSQPNPIPLAKLTRSSFPVTFSRPVFTWKDFLKIKEQLFEKEKKVKS